MSILIYSGASEAATGWSERIIRATKPGQMIERLKGAETLWRRLHSAIYDVQVGVLVIGTKGELEKISSFREMFSSMPILLILPDRDHETVSKGHRLHPRFLTYMDGDFMEAFAVLERMLERAERGR